MPVSNIEEAPSGYWDQMDLSLDELAMIFAVKGWITKTGNPPTTDELEETIRFLTDVIESAEDPGVWSNFGRIMLTQDPELDSYYSVSLEIGLLPKARD